MAEEDIFDLKTFYISIVFLLIFLFLTFFSGIGFFIGVVVSLYAFTKALIIVIKK